MGKNLDNLFRRSSKHIAKLNTLLSLAISRTAVLRNHRQVRCNQARIDVRKLLEIGQVESALLSVEQVIKEHYMFDVFVMIESYCNLLSDRLVLLEHKRECPQELREIVASLIFAASRCGDLAELHEIKGVFKSMFGSEFVSAAVELRNNCGVNPKMISKLSTREPNLEIRQKALKEISLESNIKLNLDHQPSEIAEVINLNNLIVDDENFSTPKKYKDVGSAAQVAFQSAAIAAAAARAAVELSRGQSQGKDGDDDRKKTKELEDYRDKPEGEGAQNEGDELQVKGKVYGKGVERSPSWSSSDSTETKLDSEGKRERNFGNLPFFSRHQKATSGRESSENSRNSSVSFWSRK